MSSLAMLGVMGRKALGYSANRGRTFEDGWKTTTGMANA